MPIKNANYHRYIGLDISDRTVNKTLTTLNSHLLADAAN